MGHGQRSKKDSSQNQQSTQTATGAIITQMLSELQALNINDPKLTSFCTQWANYVTTNLT
jgi:hypothetical protein